MANNTNNGSRLEGRLIEIGGLMQQDTGGKVEFLRHKITNEPDGGIDSECKIAPDFDYFKYLRGLKETGGDNGGGSEEETTKHSWTRVISQDKDINGKLSKASVDSAVSKFKEIQLGLKESSDCPLAGLELNGGDGMTRGAKESWEKFTGWCQEKKLDCEYNSNADLDKILNNLTMNVHGIPIAVLP